MRSSTTRRRHGRSTLRWNSLRTSDSTGDGRSAACRHDRGVVLYRRGRRAEGAATVRRLGPHRLRGARPPRANRNGRGNSGNGSTCNRARGRRPRRQVHPGARTGLPHRNPGAGAARAHAAPARPCGRARHRRLRQRLPRLAARRARPATWPSQVAPRAASRRVPARRQRGHRGGRVLGHPAGGARRRGRVRRRVLPLVRQGPRGRPLRRRAAPREPRGDVEARRGGGAAR